MRTAIAQVEAYQRKLLPVGFGEKLDASLGVRWLPLQRVGAYVPGGPQGTLPLFSSVIMNLVPAKVAGVPELVLVTPARKDGAHPGASRDVIRRWTAPQAGTISITGNVHEWSTAGGDGVFAIIRKNGVELKRIAIANGNATGVNFSVPTSVTAGTTIDFVINRIGTNWYDSTAFNPTIVLTPNTPTASG
jgi:hypothetical protein